MPSSFSTDDRAAPATPDPRAEIIAGLRAQQASISPKFLYDSLGSKLFEAICELPEYYPTRTEAAIMERNGEEIAAACGTRCTLIDLGAGNCAKAARLFPLLHPGQYVAIDISRDFVHGAVEQLQQRFPGIDMQAVGQDFSAGLALPDSVAASKRLFFYPGSSIGNFSPEEARAFLARLREQCDSTGGLLIGIDLVKNQATLNAAYDDALGVTAAFNLNVLRHANALAGLDFDLRDWRHRAHFDAGRRRIEMHVEAQCDVTVRWADGERHFAAGETIHTENSHKYTVDTAGAMLREAGWQLANLWTDPNEWFALVYARPAPGFQRQCP